jgi:ABC-type transport system substrate-binding protein
MNLVGNARLGDQFKKEGYKVISQSAGAYILIPDNANEKSPWANQKVREAAEYALDKEAIAKAFGYGFMEAAYQLPPPGGKAFSPSVKPRKFDTTKAKDLLKEAGMPNGFKSKIIAMTTADRDILVAIQSQLKAVGIDVDLDFVEPAKYMAYMQGTWENGLIFNTLGMSAGNPNPTIGFFLAEPRTNFKSNKNPTGWGAQYTTIMTTAQVEPKEQQKGFEMIQLENTLIPVVYYQDMYVVSNKLMDSGLGTRDDSYRWNPQDAWLAK